VSAASGPLVAVSRCLLGERVRYDGGHKLAFEIISRLARTCRLVGICPEVEAGLPVPREPAHVGGTPLRPRFVDNASGRDHTFRVMGWVEQRLQRLEREPVFGYVFKSGSPSCAAVTKVPVFTAAGCPVGRSFGLMARAFRERFPAVPVADERLLADPVELGRFLDAVLRLARNKGEG